MIKFTLSNLRRRQSVVKPLSTRYGVINKPYNVLDGIELHLEYVKDGKVVSTEEEKKVVNAINLFVAKAGETGRGFLEISEEGELLGTAPVNEIDSALAETLQTISQERDKWKTKYEETEGKRKALQLKNNEYKNKLGIADEADSTVSEGTKGNSSKKRTTRA